MEGPYLTSLTTIKEQTISDKPDNINEGTISNNPDTIN